MSFIQLSTNIRNTQLYLLPLTTATVYLYMYGYPNMSVSRIQQWGWVTRLRPLDWGWGIVDIHLIPIMTDLPADPRKKIKSTEHENALCLSSFLLLKKVAFLLWTIYPDFQNSAHKSYFCYWSLTYILFYFILRFGWVITII